MSHVSRTPLSRSKGQRSRLPGRFTHRGVNASGSCSGESGNVLAVGTYCYVVVCTLQARSARRREALRRPQREERGGGILWHRHHHHHHYLQCIGNKLESAQRRTCMPITANMKNSITISNATYGSACIQKHASIALNQQLIIKDFYCTTILLLSVKMLQH